MKRPTSVTVIAWVWIALGILAGLGGLCHLMMIGVFYEMESRMAAVRQGGPVGRACNPEPFNMVWIALPLAAVEFVVSAVALVSGAYFLKLRSWARMCLEVLSWAAFVFLVCYGVGGAIFWVYTCSSFAREGGFGPGPWFMAMGVIMGLVFCGGLAVPFALMIKFLRKKDVREAVAATAATAVPPPPEPPAAPLG